MELKLNNMKTIAGIITFAIILFTIPSCKKDKEPGILGKWNILSDSTSLRGNGDMPSSYTNYIGKPSDYYDFRTDGNLYVKEGEALDTMAYQVQGNNVGCTPSPGFTDSYNTTLLTDSSATLTVSGFTIQGQLYKIVKLKR